MSLGQLGRFSAANQVPWDIPLHEQHLLKSIIDGHWVTLDAIIAASPCKDAAGDWVLALLGREEAKGF